MKKLLLHNWGLKVISLVLAFLLWFLVAQIDDPNDTRTFSGIKVNLVNTELLERENKVYEVVDNSDVVRVTINAPKSILEQIDQSDIIAEADMSKLTDINTIAITYDVQGADINDIQGNHDVVRLNVEEKSTKWVKVIFETVGEAAEGYTIGNISSDQTLIEVSGAKSAVDQVGCVKGQISVSGASNNISANVDVQVCDSQGNPLMLDEVEMNVNYVRMSVEILATKEVPLKVKYTGTPADGYQDTGGIEYTPQTVLIAGTSSTLANISQITISEEKVDITGKSEDVSVRVNLKEILPSNIKLADEEFDGNVSIKVFIEKLIEKKLQVPDENLNFINVPQGFQIKLAEDAGKCELTVLGLEDVLSSLVENDIDGIIDVKAWMKEENKTTLSLGTYYMPVDVSLPDEVKMKNSVTMKVIISEENDT